MILQLTIHVSVMHTLNNMPPGLTLVSRPGLSIRQSRQMPRAYEGLGPTKVVL